jgi:hypothetical protein
MRLARLALALYPMAFRRRYGAELQALVEEQPLRAAVVLDLLIGALRAHLRPAAALAGELDAGTRLRLGLGGVLACWAAFAAVGFGFYKTTENHPFGAHPLLRGAHLAVQLAAGIASLAVLAGALGLIAVALRRAWGEPDRLRKLAGLVGAPVAVLLLFAVATVLLVLLAHSVHGARAAGDPGTAAQGAFVAWALGGLACGAVCVTAARRALFGIELPQRWLLAALRLATLVAGAMVAIALAAALYTIALLLDAPTLAGAGNGPFQLVSTGVSLVAEVVAMAGLGLVALSSTRRAWLGARADRVQSS